MGNVGRDKAGSKGLHVIRGMEYLNTESGPSESSYGLIASQTGLTWLGFTGWLWVGLTGWFHWQRIVGSDSRMDRAPPLVRLHGHSLLAGHYWVT